MVQKTGETRDAIIEDDNKQIQAIISANKANVNPYWIVVFAKPAKTAIDGYPTLVKHIKAYNTKPLPKVGQVVGEVNNHRGTIQWDVNMPQVPFDFDALQIYGAKPCDEVVVETTSIPGAYVTR